MYCYIAYNAIRLISSKYRVHFTESPYLIITMSQFWWNDLYQGEINSLQIVERNTSKI